MIDSSRRDDGDGALVPEGGIQLIVLDIDGTLVDDSKQIPDVNLRALRAARDRGVHVAIASGRMVPSIAAMEDRLGLDCALIAYNGAKVVGPRSEGRRCISHSPVPLEVSRRVAAFARQNGHLLNLYVDDVLYADNSHSRHSLADLYFRRTGSVYEFVAIEELESRPTTKMILLEEPEEVERLHARFSRELDGASNVVITEREYLEFMANEIDKATALPTLAAHYGLDVGQVMAVGDADNDQHMLRVAGLGVAVANARVSALESADVVTRRSNNEGAVAEAVSRWVLREPIAGLE